MKTFFAFAIPSWTLWFLTILVYAALDHEPGFYVGLWVGGLGIAIGAVVADIVKD